MKHTNPHANANAFSMCISFLSNDDSIFVAFFCCVGGQFNRTTKLNAKEHHGIGKMRKSESEQQSVNEVRMQFFPATNANVRGEKALVCGDFFGFVYIFKWF